MSLREPLVREPLVRPEVSRGWTVLWLAVMCLLIGGAAWFISHRQQVAGIASELTASSAAARLRRMFVGPPRTPDLGPRNRVEPPPQAGSSRRPGAPAAVGRTDAAGSGTSRESAEPSGTPGPALRRALQAAEQEFRNAQVLFEQGDYAGASKGFARVMALVEHDADLGADLHRVAGEFAAVSRERAAREAARVYTERDLDVLAPVALVGSSLPVKPAPERPPDRLDVLEIVINTDGFVEKAQLITSRNHYRNRWWVSASKAWRFRPAMRAGRPVRFVKRIPIADGDA